MSDSRALIAYIVSNELVKHSSLLPSNPNRSLLVHTLIKDFDLLSQSYSNKRRILVIKPHIASYQDLVAYHSKDYLDFILNGNEEGSPAGFGLEDDCPVFPGLKEYVCCVAGATLTAVNALKVPNVEVAICWDGGRHHAQRGRASGFCYVADCVLAILLLKRLPPCPKDTESTFPARKARVMYIDLDVHFSDGVSHAFYQPHSSMVRHVLTLSIHHSSPGYFPISPLSSQSTVDPYTISIPLEHGLSSKTYLAIWPYVERIRDAFDPDYVVVQCGVDGLAGDPGAGRVGNWCLGGEGSLGWCVQRILETWRGKKLLLGGGGYHSPNAARAWAYLTSIALANPLPLDTPIPHTHDAFPEYAPSFELDVPASNMEDRNWSIPKDPNAECSWIDSLKGRLEIACQTLEELSVRE
ncbi:histone deacetylase 8 [Moniliophthora roreri]|nr:histone deacetylase 8 [Moniliophthora roreri]